jgi:hypothetical protein
MFSDPWDIGNEKASLKWQVTGYTSSITYRFHLEIPPLVSIVSMVG